MRGPAAALAALAAALSAAAPAPAGGYTFDASLPLLPADKAALLAFKAGLESDDGMLAGWSDTATEHPCTWFGVSCDCSDLYPSPPAVHACPPDPAGRTHNRVVFLEIGGGAKPAGKFLRGPVAMELGSLAELRIIYLHMNKLSGPLPKELGNLSHLARLIIRDNELSGTLPAELGALNLKDLYFDGNRLSGPIPPEWCQMANRADSVLSVIHPGGNAGLCGRVPECFTALYESTSLKQGTYLIHGTSPASAPDRVSGYCDSTPPTCGPGCGVSMSLVTSSLTFLDFSFTGFDDADSGMRRYEWGIGTKPGGTDAFALTQYTGHLTQDTSQVYKASYNASGTQLIGGKRYFITVVGENLAGPPMRMNTSSASILVDATPPEPGRVYLSAMCDDVSTTSVRDQLEVCWQPFGEPESWITQYQISLEKRGGVVVRGWTMADTNRTHIFQELSLEVDAEYIVCVKAWNAAELSTSSFSYPLSVVKPSGSYETLLSIALPLGAVAVLAAAGGVYVAMKRKHAAAMQRSADIARNSETLLGMLQNSVQRIDSLSKDGNQAKLNFLSTSDNMVFVVTDLENSTAASNANPQAYHEVQEVHDAVIRDLITVHSGHEINTQGDAFEIAFTDVAKSVAFCVEVQHRLLVHTWSKEVLALPSCGQKRGPTGALTFAGPRVRMGVHVAAVGEYTSKLHDMSKHLVFDGPGFRLARALGDAAYGGQILMTHAALELLVGHHAEAKNPVLMRLGTYSLEGVGPQTLYQVQPHWGSETSPRHFPLEKLSCGAERMGGTQTRDVVPAHSIVSRVSSRGPLAALVVFANKTISQATALELHQMMTSIVQQFGGAMVSIEDERTAKTLEPELSLSRGSPSTEPRMSRSSSSFSNVAALSASRAFLPVGLTTFAFASATDATACASTLQFATHLASSLPRISIVVHASAKLHLRISKPEDTIVHVESQQPMPPMTRIEDTAQLQGQPLDLMTRLVRLVAEGQAVLTEDAWASMQEHIPTRVSVLSLGRHVLWKGAEMDLLEVSASAMPVFKFPKPRVLEELSVGYHFAPETERGVAIVFCRATPQEGQTSLTGDSVHKWAELCRRTYADYGGYECKEPDPGKFTLAFQSFLHALAFAAAVQSEARAAACKDRSAAAVCVGVAYGTDAFKKPLASSGRADYFGSLPNLAARVMGQAKPGQSLAEISLPLADNYPLLKLVPERTAGNSVFVIQGVAPRAGAAKDLRLTKCGWVQLKGVTDTKMIVQLDTYDDPVATFPRPKGWVYDEKSEPVRRVGSLPKPGTRRNS